jgi:Flp pilus assembly protein CpaB
MNRPRISIPTRSAAPATNGGPPQLQVRQPPPAPPGDGTPTQNAGRRLLQPLPVAGAVLILIALVGAWGILNASTKRTQILVTTHALPAGTVLSGGDLRSGELAGDSSVLASLVPEHDLSQTIGRRLTTAVPGGTPLSSGALTMAQGQSSAMTLAVPDFDVTGAGLQAGDSVSVLATFGAGSGQANTRAVARGLRVVSVGEAAANADPSTATIPVTVAVSEPAIASSLALANEDGKLDLLLEGSSASTAPIPQATQAAKP